MTSWYSSLGTKPKNSDHPEPNSVTSSKPGRETLKRPTLLTAVTYRHWRNQGSQAGPRRLEGSRENATTNESAQCDGCRSPNRKQQWHNQFTTKTEDNILLSSILLSLYVTHVSIGPHRIASHRIASHRIASSQAYSITRVDLTASSRKNATRGFFCRKNSLRPRHDETRWSTSKTTLPTKRSTPTPIPILKR
jgi:hypothetical protein